jgi:hypothetical protein
VKRCSWKEKSNEEQELCAAVLVITKTLDSENKRRGLCDAITHLPFGGVAVIHETRTSPETRIACHNERTLERTDNDTVGFGTAPALKSNELSGSPLSSSR